MKPDLDHLERTVGARLRQAMPPVALSPEAIDRMRPRTGTARVLHLPLAPRVGHFRWKRALVAALVVAVAGTAFLGLIPSGRAIAAAAVAKVTSVWKGQLGHTPAELLWTEQPMQQSSPPAAARTETVVGSVQEAAAKVGFQPVQATLNEAGLREVKVVIADGDEYQSRWVALTYLLKERPFKLVTMVHYRKADGEWKPIPQSTVVGYAVSEQVTRNVRTVQAGGVEGLAFEVFEGKFEGKEFWRTDVTWMPPGNQRIVRLHGADATLTEVLAKSAQ